MAGPTPRQAISVADHLLAEARNVLRVAKNLMYMKGLNWGYEHAKTVLNDAGIDYRTHEGDHDTPARHGRVH